ncbi:sulfite exporter family [Trichoderma cornu-damae]|uniref:Sulfite exporter family n=1 Tax=Trichoderma cornu-damae TaxID=654480 RepID=A0A9P8TWK9_9HYPO|nr:sulfite exporter family [Trichoderma cornu-damae]
MLKSIRPWALLCLLLLLQLAAARDFRALRRDDSPVSSPTASFSSPKPGSQPSVTKESVGNSKQTDAPRGPTTTKAPDGTTVAKPPIHTTATVAAENPVNSSTLFNGWGVAGILLMLTGLVYTLVGINNRWINCFFSTAYIASLGIAVLIVYIMSLPVSEAVQGAYVVAVALSGCALGAASLIFKELTEGLGCALGGFCLSMWLLCLAPGGLLHGTLGRAVFISSFSVVGFGFYFSRYTRNWAMIILLPFGGSTAIVLGIDCYSRAGLKEFWAYIWNLNENLFPLGSNTYPVTRGIRVEISAIAVICLVGIISQVKLWKIVRAKREKKALDLAVHQRYLEQQEEDVGRSIEEQTARERVEWEKVYGGRTLNNSNGTVSHYSDATNSGDSGKRLRGGRSESVYTDSKVDGIEMADLSDSSVVRAGLISAEVAEEGKVMVRVAVDEVVETPDSSDGEEANEKTDAVSGLDAALAGDDKTGPQTDMAKGKQTSEFRRSSRRRNVAPAPEVVPLPFKVPTEDDLKSVGDRSSVATFADDEAIAPAIHPRDSLVKRVSQNSVSLLRNLPPQRLKGAPSERQLESGESSEELVELAAIPNEDDGSSLAATVDYESMTDGDDHDTHGSTASVGNRKSIEITAELGQAEKAPVPEHMNLGTAAENNAAETEGDASKEVAEHIVQVGPHDDPGQTNSESSKTRNNFEMDKGESEVKIDDSTVDEATSASREQEPTAAVSSAAGGRLPESTEKSGSISSATSNLASLTKDRLPTPLSKVALSYRTNEWAKHLSHAETPEPDAIYIEPYVSEKEANEVPRYVDVEDLQRTIADGTPPPAAKRSDSKIPQASSVQSNSKFDKKQRNFPSVIISAAVLPDAVSPDGSPGSPPLDAPSLQRASVALRRTSSGFAPIVEEQDSPPANAPTHEDISHQDGVPLNPAPNNSFRPIIPRIVSFSNQQTLLGQRESVLWSRSQGNLVQHISEIPIQTPGSVCDADSLHNYPVHNRALSPDPDDLPLSRRREMMRQSSMANLPPSNYRLNRLSSGVEVSGNTQFNSHQPKRISSISAIAQEAKLAHFRQSVAHDLRSMTPGVPNIGRETPFASTSTLIDDIDAQRTALIEKKEAELQRKEMQRREKEWHDRMFDSRMRSGDLLEAHREVLRKMQSSAKDA